MKLTAKQIERYKGKSIPKLLKVAESHCHEYIRMRDKGKPCVSCSKKRLLQAGHFYPAGKYSMLKFYEWNIHGQCEQCNKYGTHSDGGHYVMEMQRRIGLAKVEDLIQKSIIAKRNMPYKWDRFTIIHTIYYYIDKKKKLRLCAKQ